MEKQSNKDFSEENLGKKFVDPQFGVVTICGYCRRYFKTIIVASSTEPGWTTVDDSDIIKKKSKAGYLYTSMDDLTPVPSLLDKLKTFFSKGKRRGLKNTKK